MRVSLEPLKPNAFLLRVHTTPDGDWKLKSPYTWCCTVVIEHGVAEFKGVDKPPSAAELSAIKDYFRNERLDVHTAFWERSNGTVFTVDLKR